MPNNTAAGTGGTTAAAGAPTLAPAPVAKVSTKAFYLAGVLLALLLAGFASYYASASPDGLEKVAAEQGFHKAAEEHHLADSPLAGYQTKDMGNARLSGGLAGVAGVAGTLAVGTGLFWVARRTGAARRG